MQMLSGRFYIKNYHFDYNIYFPLKVKGLIEKDIFTHVHRETAFGASVSKRGCLCYKDSPRFWGGGK